LLRGAFFPALNRNRKGAGAHADVLSDRRRHRRRDGRTRPSLPHAARFIISTAVGAALFAGLLGTTFLRGLAISAIAMIIQTVLGLVLISALVGFAANTGA